MKKLIAIVALVASLAGVSVLASASPASASAYGCQGFRTVNSPWGSGNVNSYCVDLQGSGTYVRSVSGAFTANVGSVCNYNITAEFFDAQGRWYMTRQSPVRYGCTWGTQYAGGISINQYVQRGFMCSTLKQNGSRLTSVCHNIY